MKPLTTILAFFLLASLASTSYCQSGRRVERTLEEMHRYHLLKVRSKVQHERRWGKPKKGMFSIVSYTGKAGRLSAMLSKAPRQKDPKVIVKHPAIIWVTGGFPPGGMGSSAWEKPDPNNDQSAQAFRKAKIVTMYPAFRGDMGNDGFIESFFGEVQDIVSAAKYLKTLPHIDPKRIYLGGHSTGGTMVLLAAQLSDTFRAVFSFGPQLSASHYGASSVNFDITSNDCCVARAPICYLHCIQTPTFIIEGDDGVSAIDALKKMKAANKNPLAQFFPINLGDHFDILQPLNRLIAAKIVKQVDDKPFQLTQKELQAAYFKGYSKGRKYADTEQLNELRRLGNNLKKPRLVAHFFSYSSLEKIRAAADYVEEKKLGKGIVRKVKPEGNPPYFTLTVTKKLSLKNVRAVNAMSKKMCKIRHQLGIHYNGWDLHD